MKQTCSQASSVLSRFRYIALLLMMLPICAFAQTVNVFGTVTDESTGEEVIGATVKVKGAAGGVITDYEGKYKTLGYNYPKAFVHNNSLYVSYSVNKEDVQCTIIP